MDEAVEEPLIGLFDMDGSLFEFEGEMRRLLELMRAPQEPPIPENLWDLDNLGYMKHRMRAIKSTPGFWLNLEPIQAGMKVLNAARDMGYLINILTKGPVKISIAWSEKVECCHRHIPAPFDMHVTTNKGLTYGNMLYDDFPGYMLSWLKFRPRGLGIMPACINNRDFSHPQVVKYTDDNFDEVVDALSIAANRKPGEALALPWKRG